MIRDTIGVISGAATVNIRIVFTGVVSAITVSGKAIGKSISLRFATSIVLLLDKCFCVLEFKSGIRIFKKKRRKNRRK